MSRMFRCTFSALKSTRLKAVETAICSCLIMPGFKQVSQTRKTLEAVSTALLTLVVLFAQRPIIGGLDEATAFF